MQHYKIFNLKSIFYLFLFGMSLSLSAFSCEVYEPLEIRIENKTGYDLKDIRADNLEIPSLKKGQTSKYISVEEFKYLLGVSVTIKDKFDRSLSSPYLHEWDNLYWCGTGMNDYPPSQKRQPNTLESGKHTFVVTIHKGVDSETLSFEKK